MALLAVAALAGGTAACSGDDEAGDAPGGAPSGDEEGTATATTAPAGPVAELTALDGGDGPFVAAATTPDLDALGYVEEEYAASGTATSYAPEGELGGDGRWTLRPDASAPYRTRVLVRRPADADDMSGTVVVEWLNVSGGADANPDYVMLEEEIARRGHVWVGVSAQRIGVEGGPVLVTAPGGEGIAGKGLKALDPARYGSLEHPGDGFAFDIFTQVARAVRAGGPITAGARPDRVLAVGESQSAVALTTYYNGVQPIAGAFDGFLVHSRGSVALPFVGPGEHADLAGSIGGGAVLLRDDLDAPALVLQAEGDVIGVLSSYAVRQDDTDTYRLWEVAGTAHADTRLVGATAEQLDCGAPVNDGPMHVVAKAALRALEEWVRTGDAPPEAPRLEVAGDPPAIVRDGDGIARGGIRTPPVDVPVVVLSGAPPPNPDLLCILLGSTTPLPPERIRELYASRADYEQRYAAAADDAIATGFVLEEDREALLGYADPSAVPG
ncbi:MAG: hypothetical protein KatS3mg009_0863 [Acidimicrobiia bacterium]|nr:MAG: hypothetical protein KatS3mg009_0863 [Acidimicrobiia bacterium]